MVPTTAPHRRVSHEAAENDRVCGYHRAPQDWRGLVRCNDGAQLELTSLRFLKLLDDDQVSSHMVKKTHSNQKCGTSSLCNVDADANPA